MRTDKIKKLTKHMPAILAGVCVWVFLWIVTGSSCWIRSIFGIPCPGCGSTRAAAEIFRGNIAQALKFHPLIFLSAAILAACIISLVFGLKLFAKFKAPLWCCVFLYMGVYVVRMVMYFPQAEPMIYLGTSMLGRVIGFFG
jgi:hypothetical protein